MATHLRVAMATHLILSLSFLTLLALAFASLPSSPDLRPARSSSLVSIFLASSLSLEKNRSSTHVYSTFSQNRRLLVSTPETPQNKGPTPPSRRWFSLLAMGTGVGAFTAMLLLLVVRQVLKCLRKVFKCLRKQEPERTVIFQHKWVKAKQLAFLDKQDGLERAELLGQGGSGKVYRAVFEDGTVVAIKKVISFVNEPTRSPNKALEEGYDLTKNSRQIQAEIKTLGHVRHRNLVSLLAYVPKVDAHLLIYEFMENGSLHDALIKIVNGSLILTWPMRHKIAVGIATALKYLHFECNPSVVHRDIKPGNILLDEEFEAHLGDFGLAKSLPDSVTHFSTDQIAGTLGYIAPEYHQTLRYTAKGDIYSFGVVLTVLITGKEPADLLSSAVQTHMGDWIRDSLASGREAAIACFDSTLRDQGFEEEMFLAFKIAAFCVDGSPVVRPSSVDVLAMLLQIRPIR